MTKYEEFLNIRNNQKKNERYQEFLNIRTGVQPKEQVQQPQEERITSKMDNLFETSTPAPKPVQTQAPKSSATKSIMTGILSSINPTGNLIPSINTPETAKKAAETTQKSLSTVPAAFAYGAKGVLKGSESILDSLLTRINEEDTFRKESLQQMNQKIIEDIKKDNAPSTTHDSSSDRSHGGNGIKIDTGKKKFTNNISKLEKEISDIEQSKNYGNAFTEEFIKKDLIGDTFNTPMEQFRSQNTYLPKKAGEIIESTGAMIPSIYLGGKLTSGLGLNGATGKIGEVAKQTSNMLPFVAQATGGSLEQALNEGATYEKALPYANMSGALEGIIEGISGGIGGYTGNKIIGSTLGKEAIEKISKNIIGKYAVKLADAGIDVAGEGFEEVLSTLVDPFLKRMTYDQQAELATKEDALQSFVDGALASILIKGGNSLSQRIANRSTPQQNRKPLEPVQQVQPQIIPPAQTETVVEQPNTEQGAPMQDNILQGAKTKENKAMKVEIPKDSTPVKIMEYSDFIEGKNSMFEEITLTAVENAGKGMPIRGSITYRIQNGVPVIYSANMSNQYNSERQKEIYDMLMKKVQDTYPNKEIQFSKYAKPFNGNPSIQVESTKVPLKAIENILPKEVKQNQSGIQSDVNLSQNISPITNIQEATKFVETATVNDIDTLKNMVSEAKKNPNRIDLQMFAEKAQRKLDELIDKYGAISKGENAVRDVELPKQAGKKKYVSQFARTMAEAGVTNEETVDLIKDDVESGKLSHERITDKHSLAHSERFIKTNGFENTVKYWDSLVNTNKEIGKDDFAIGIQIYNQAVQNKDVPLVKKMIGDLVIVAKEAGQTLQASRLLKKMTPDGRLYSLEKSLKKINQELLDRYGKDYPEIKIPNELASELLNSQDQKQIDAAVEKIQLYIADRAPSTWLDKINAWRYLAMLGNPKTHIKNIVGNALFVPVKGLKNVIATGLEQGISKEQRTKAILTKGDKNLIDFAKDDFEQNKDSLRGESKYDIGTGIKDKIKVFNLKPLETVRKLNFDALEAEDLFFFKKAYTSAMAQEIKAKGLNLANLQANTKESNTKLESIRANAVLEAQKATYRDLNAFARGVNQLKRKALIKSQESKGIGGKIAYGAANLALEGAVPFAKTPSNIIKRGIEYSPIGLATGIVNNFANVKNGNMTASQAIDQISSGLSGTLIMGLGSLLYSLGLITGGADEDKKEEDFETLKGMQNYALQIGDSSYTIDWSAPASMPLFVGVEIMKSFSDKDSADVIEGISRISEPVFETTMLQGINSSLKAASYNQSSAIAAIAGNTVQNYAGQFNPSLVGGIARTIDPVRRTTYVDKGSVIPSGVQNVLQRQGAKIPFVSKTLLPKYDQFGRKDEEKNVGTRIFENFLSPGYISKDKSTVVENELDKLYKQTGDKEILPSYASKYVTVNGVKKDLNAKEYETFVTERGQKAYKQLEGLFADSQYKSLAEEDKLSLIKSIYDYSNKVAKTKVSDYSLKGTTKGMSKDEKIAEAEKNGIPAYKYLTILKSADKDNNSYLTENELKKAISISNLKQAQKDYLNKLEKK